ncbi:MAG: PIN domain nuclease, a component of toxin-antitoxin system (PIN domain) [uncultured Sulfurovum sp.]|uniref:PIN domain nuclease, a component of toxin-antitoxin system (PIN domain) n=1 Tax=uncultured Sulfurovum sp. TaxID=269237 RepID=A0A6S6TCK6_9BACT|nr:MAG: PIN domain nuclease, a component of toxin-antitoxin system (PIN domain) [uncultured Sulfurovum sp.]
MNYIIDTHIFLWLLFEPTKVPEPILKTLKDSSNNVSITSISFWEISLKFNLGKLELNGTTPEELPSLAQKMGLDLEQIATQEMASFHKLEKNSTHKDPFDRIIIWHCISHKKVLISLDGKFNDYEKFGLKVLK